MRNYLKTVAVIGVIVSILTGCSGKKEPPFDSDEINKTNLTKMKHEVLLGTGYWGYINYISIKENSSGNPYFAFHMNNYYWEIKDTDTRMSIIERYDNMQRVFEAQVGLNKKIQISTY